MADKGIWTISAGRGGLGSQTVYLNLGPTQGPLVVYRIHNDGPDAIFVTATATGFLNFVEIRPGRDSDVSGSEIHVGFGPGRGATSASGTFDLVCCKPLVQGATPAAASVTATDQGTKRSASRPKRAR